MDSIYTETLGTTCYLDGQRGTVTGLRHTGRILVGAFVLMADVDEMRYVKLGDPTGGRGQFHPVQSHRKITRDEFDRLNGLDVIRTELGWKL